MLWSVYILRCGDGSLYTGISTDVEKRLKQHQSGKGAAYTRSHLPVTLAWSQIAPRIGKSRKGSESAARKREAGIKKMTRAQKLELIKKPVGR